jgi:hypothetical protein
VFEQIGVVNKFKWCIMKLAEAKERIELLEAQIKAITAILTEL